MLRLRSDQQVRAGFSFQDKKGNKTTAESVRLESSDPDVAKVVTNDDGSFTIVAGQTGVAQLNFSADAKIGEGERIITGSDVIEVVPGEAAVLKLTLGEPEDQPEEVPVPPAPTTPTEPEPVDPAPTTPTEPVDPAPVDPAPTTPVG